MVPEGGSWWANRRFKYLKKNRDFVLLEIYCLDNDIFVVLFYYLKKVSQPSAHFVVENVSIHQ